MKISLYFSQSKITSSYLDDKWREKKSSVSLLPPKNRVKIKCGYLWFPEGPLRFPSVINEFYTQVSRILSVSSSVSHCFQIAMLRSGMQAARAGGLGRLANGDKEMPCQ